MNRLFIRGFICEFIIAVTYKADKDPIHIARFMRLS